MRYALYVIFLLGWLCPSASGQQLVFNHIGEEEGLPQSEVKCITRDQYGFLWIATQAGITRYDGVNFESYAHEEIQGLEAGLIDLQVYGDFVYGLFPKFYILIHTKTLKVEKKFFPAESKILNPRKIASDDKQIFITSENGLWVLNSIDGRLLNHFDVLGVVDILAFGQGKWLIGSATGIFMYYPFTQRLVSLNLFPNAIINQVCLNGNNTFSWLQSNGRIYEASLNGLNLKMKRVIEVPSTKPVNCFSFYRDKYYLGLNEGLLEMSSNGSTFLYEQNFSNPLSLSGNAVTCLYSDAQDRFWIGTFFGGLNSFNPYSNKFNLVNRSYIPVYSEVKGIMSFAEINDKKILFSTLDGQLGYFNPEKAEIFELKKIGNAFFELIKHPYDKDKFLGGTIKGLIEITPASGKMKFISTKGPNKNFDGDVLAIEHWKDQLFWMAGSRGLFLYDLSSQKAISYFNIGNSNLVSDDLRGLLLLNPNELLIGTGAGMMSFHIPTQTFKLINLNAGAKEQPFVSQMMADKIGRVWIGSNNGLYIKDYAGRVFHLSTKNGLPDNSVFALQFSNDQEACWISTNKGLSKVSTRDFQVSSYNVFNGLQGNEFIEASSLKTQSGELFFGGMNGFNYFMPQQIALDSLSFQVTIAGIKDFNTSLTQEPYHYFKSENFLTFDYIAMNYNMSNSNTYYYQLDGLGEQWIEAGSRRFASFGQLLPGDYVFKVKAKNMDGYWSSNMASVHFTIKPVFYKTIWFRISIALFFVLMIGGILYYRVRTAFLKQEEEARLNSMIGELELKALRAQMNPHFIFNSLNSIQDFVLNNEGRLAAKYLSKFAKLIRMILDVTEQTFVRIESNIDFLKLYIDLEALRLNNAFTWELSVDERIDKDDLIPSLLIQPHVENAIWHGLQYETGKERKLHLQFHYHNAGFIRVEVLDNGIGRMASRALRRNRAKGHTSMGTRITEDRLKVLQKLFGSEPSVQIIDLFDENNIACGTKVVIMIPVKHE